MNTLSLLLMIYMNFAIAQPFKKPETIETKSKVYANKKHFVIFNHTTSFWDELKSSREGTLELLKKIKSNPRKYESILVADNSAFKNKESATGYYIKDTDVDHIVNSDSGRHKLDFPQSEIVIFSGGNLSMCLCESIRDVIRIKANSHRILDIVLVEDAIYDYTEFANSNGLRNYFTNEHENFKKILDEMSEKKIKDFFSVQVMGLWKSQMCPVQDTSDRNIVDPKHYRFVLIRAGSIIGVTGSGKKTVNVHMTSVKDFDLRIKGIEARRQSDTLNFFQSINLGLEDYSNRLIDSFPRIN